MAKKSVALLVAFVFHICVFICFVSIVFFANVGNLSIERAEETKNYEVESFDEIRFDGLAKLSLIQGQEERVEVIGPKNLIEKVTIKSDENTLSIGSESRSIFDFISFSDDLQINIYFKSLDQLIIKGVGNVINKGTLKFENLKIELTSTANVELNGVEGRDINVHLRGFGNIEISGIVQTQVVVVDGTGNYKSPDLESNSAEVTIKGVGNAEIQVKQKLNAIIDGVGNISYLGNPELVEKDINGLGNLEKK